MNNIRILYVDAIFCAFLLAVGFVLAWLGDYRGRQILELERQALVNHERIILQNNQILNAIKNLSPTPSYPSETPHGPSQNP